MRPALLLGFVLLLMSCGDGAPLLLQVDQLEPRAVESGDVVLVHGDGFSDRSAGQLVFEGTVHRVGAHAAQVRATIETKPHSRQLTEAEVSSEFIERMLGEDPNTDHATFRGTVRTSFAPLTSGAPPISGVMQDVVLDVFRRADESGETPDELPYVDALVRGYGWTLERRVPGGVCVSELREAPRESPLAAGDCIETFAGLNVFSSRDLTPAPGQRSASLQIVSATTKTLRTAQLELDGLRPRQAAVWQWPLVLCAMIASGIIVCRSPLATALSLIEAKLSARLRKRIARDTKRERREQRPSLGGLVPFLAVSALFACSGLGVSRGFADFDILLVHASGAALLLTAQLLGGGRQLGRWSLAKALTSIARGIGVQVTAALAVSAAIFNHASFSMLEVASAQGGAPWDFHAFRSVGSYFSSLTLLCLVVLLGLMRFDDSPHTSEGTERRPRLTQALLDTDTWVLAGLLTAVYLGGWQVPEPLSALAPKSQLLGPLVFQLKLTLIFIAITWLRTLVPRVPERSVAPVFWRWLLPLSLIAALLDLVWASGSWPAWLESASTWTLLLSSALVSVGLLLRLLQRQRQPAPAMSVNPWL